MERLQVGTAGGNPYMHLSIGNPHSPLRPALHACASAGLRVCSRLAHRACPNRLTSAPCLCLTAMHTQAVRLGP